MPDEALRVHEPYRTATQQAEADTMGMYVFLATEVMLFGGLFAAALMLRTVHHDEVIAASRQLHIWIGTANTALLLTSSLFVATAVVAARAGARRLCASGLIGGAVLGLCFMALKAIEYYSEYRVGHLPGFGLPTHFSNGAEHLFMNLYLVATGLHAVHLAIGIVLLLSLAARVLWTSFPLPERSITVTLFGLYWHLVDVIWIFLFPVLYLAR